MKRLLFHLILFLPLLSHSIHDPASYMKGRLPIENGRYETFFEALQLLSERKATIIVETGTARCGDTNFEGDGGSTILFGHWSYDHNAHFYSVDISERHIDIARNVVTPYITTTTFILRDSVDFLQEFSQPIDFLYLDSWDYDVNDPLAAQMHCLHEIQAAYKNLSNNSIVMIDDCNVPGGGKGKLAIQWLLDRNWYLHRNKHQVILLHRTGNNK